MDSLAPLAPCIVITLINVVGWVYTKVFALGRLKEKVERHEKVLDNGIVKELNELKSQVANLTGTVQTYIDLTK